jgi:hypothetical protein
MRVLLLALVFAIGAGAASAQPGAADPFAGLKALAGEWQAELPGFGTMTDTIRLVSNGRGMEETIGAAADNEVSIYTRDNQRILLTHFCAMTPDGHVARLETVSLKGQQSSLTFIFRDAVNLHSPAAPHMRKMSLTITDADHFSEKMDPDRERRGHGF